MICFNCKTQIPDGVPNCPNCGAPIIPPVQITREIKVRRWQRWVFYALLVLLFIGETVYAAKIYTDNAKLLSTSVQMQQAFSQAKSELDTTKQDLGNKNNQLTQAQTQAQQLQTTLDQKAQELQTASTQKETALSQFNQLKANLSTIDANAFNMLIQIGTAMSNKDLARIPLADANFKGQDTDGDGLPDILEEALGTDKTKADTDGDTYNDKQEMLSGYSPTTSTKLAIDAKFAKANAGKVLLQMEGKGEAWYVNPKDNKRYFLGRPADAIKALEGLTATQ